LGGKLIAPDPGAADGAAVPPAAGSSRINSKGMESFAARAWKESPKTKARAMVARRINLAGSITTLLH
jgi:hypothetical protein